MTTLDDNGALDEIAVAIAKTKRRQFPIVLVAMVMFAWAVSPWAVLGVPVIVYAAFVHVKRANREGNASE